MKLLWDLQVSWGESLWILTCCKHHIALFSFYEFFPWSLSYKVFNEAISPQGHDISFIFPHGFFGGWYSDIICIVLFSLCEFSLWGFSYKVFDEAMPAERYMLYHISSPQGFLEDNIWSILIIRSRCY